MKKAVKNVPYAVIFTPAEEGGYIAAVPELPGCFSDGDTFEDAKQNVAEAISLYVSVSGGKSRRVSDFIVAPVRAA